MNRLNWQRWMTRGPIVVAGGVLAAVVVVVAYSLRDAVAADPPASAADGVNLLKQTKEEAAAKSVGCITCHQTVHDPHEKETLNIGCVDCHGGDASAKDVQTAHVHPRFPEAWATSAKPVRTYTLLNHETPEFVRFVNPGDLRVAGHQLRHVRLPRHAGGTGQQVHDDHRLHVVGRRPVQQRRHPQQALLLRRQLHRRRRAAAAGDRAAADRGGVPQEGRRALPRPAAALRDHAAGQHPPHLRARRRIPAPTSASRIGWRIRAGRSSAASASAAWAPRTAPTPPCSASRRRACSTRRSTSWGPTTTPATTAPAAAAPATSSTPTTAPG